MPINHFQCSVCSQCFDPSQVTYTCLACGGNLDAHFSFEDAPHKSDPSSILQSNETSIWRYASLLAAPDPGFGNTPLHQVGWTPIYQPAALRESLGLQELWIKDESRNPSASFKDRASALVIARAIEANIQTIIAASTGNAGAAMACMAASVGKQAVIIAPRSAPPAKVAQLLTFGARVLLVDGTYDQAFDLSIEASRELGWYNRNTGFNPYTVEGKKTAGLEIWEQVLLPRGNRAQNLTIFIPVGDGNILSGVAKGFVDLLALGWIEKLPRLVGVQAEGSAAIFNAWKAGSDKISPVCASTIADSISVDLPRDGLRALERVRQSGGYFVKVTDEEILQAIPTLGKAGLFVEPAAAAAFAGLKSAMRLGLHHPDEPALVLCTGSGLKDISAAMRAVEPAPVIEPTLKQLKEVLHV